MAVVAVFEGVTREQYEESVRKLTGKSRLDSPADWPVEGLLDSTKPRQHTTELLRIQSTAARAVA